MGNRKGYKRTAKLVDSYTGPVRLPHEKIEPKDVTKAASVKVGPIAPSGAHERLRERRSRSG